MLEVGVLPKTKEVVVEIVIINFSLEGLSETDYESRCDEVAPAFAAVPRTDVEGVVG